MEFRLPRLKFGNLTVNGYLITTIIIFAFLLGMLTNKVLYLENAVKTASKAQTNQAAAPAPTEPPAVVKVDNGHLPLLGNANAKVTVVEFSDFQCPFCKSFFDNTSPQLNDTYIKTGKIKFAYRQFPLTSIHPNAQISAEASECAEEQNRFWEYHDTLFKNQETWTPLSGTDVINSLTDLAGQVGMDTNQFSTCLSTHKYKSVVDADESAGSAVGVNGTPTFFVNGHRLVGAVPFDQFKTLIDQELKK